MYALFMQQSKDSDEVNVNKLQIDVIFTEVIISI